MIEDGPRLSSLAFIGFQINAAIDDGYADKITFEQVYKGLEDENLFELLNRELPHTFDFSLFPKGNDQTYKLYKALQWAASGLEGRERRKTGVEKSGLTLLIAFILECMQHRAWSDA